MKASIKKIHLEKAQSHPFSGKPGTPKQLLLTHKEFRIAGRGSWGGGRVESTTLVIKLESDGVLLPEEACMKVLLAGLQ